MSASTVLLADYYSDISFQEGGYVGTGQRVVQSPLISGEKDGSGSVRLVTQSEEVLGYEKILNVEKIKNPKSQVEYLRDVLGFNISQLATILDVQRPTIYEWLEDKEPNPRNQERLDKIYSFFSDWRHKHGLRIGGYFYKKFEKNKSLYDLLIEEDVNENQIVKYISKIKNILILNEEAEFKRNKNLKDAGFVPVSQEQKKRALRGLLRRA